MYLNPIRFLFETLFYCQSRIDLLVRHSECFESQPWLSTTVQEILRGLNAPWPGPKLKIEIVVTFCFECLIFGSTFIFRFLLKSRPIVIPKLSYQKSQHNLSRSLQLISKLLTVHNFHFNNVVLAPSPSQRFSNYHSLTCCYL